MDSQSMQFREEEDDSSRLPPPEIANEDRGFMLPHQKILETLDGQLRPAR